MFTIVLRPSLFSDDSEVLYLSSSIDDFETDESPTFTEFREFAMHFNNYAVVLIYLDFLKSLSFDCVSILDPYNL